MDLTQKPNTYGRAPSSKMVRAKYFVSVQIPIVQNGHSRSRPAEVDTTETSPRFRTGKATELPVDIGSSAISSEPAWEPIGDPTLATKLPGE